MLFKFLWLIISSCIVLFAISGCATQDVKGKTEKPIDKQKLEVTIDPHHSYEECFTLFETQRLDYSFETSKPVNFNIHYHAEGGMFYPVSQNNISVLKGTFSTQEEKHYSKEQEYFCMMWENPHDEHVNLTCTYQVQSK